MYNDIFFSYFDENDVYVHDYISIYIFTVLTLNEENVNEKKGNDEGDEIKQDILEENEEEENIPEEDFEEEEIVRAKDNRLIYVRKVLKSKNVADSSQPNRKLDTIKNTVASFVKK